MDMLVMLMLQEQKETMEMQVLRITFLTSYLITILLTKFIILVLLYYQNLMQNLRDAIEQGTLDNFVEGFYRQGAFRAARKVG